nr:T9SS type A sorting domain-containing protein [uncultured Flavobacterium sp.]
MKKIYFLVIALCFFTTVKSQIVSIPDANFKAKLLSASSGNTIAKNLLGNYFKIDSNYNNQIELTEALQVSYLNVSSSTLSSLQGILSFTNLQNLYCSNNKITSLDLGGLINLQNLYCSNNQISSLNIAGLMNLRDLYCEINYLSSINLNGLTNLEILNCSGNNFSSLNLGGLENLKNLDCHSNSSYILTLDLSGLTNLVQVDCSYITLTKLITGGLTKLQQLNCSNNSLTALNLIDSINLVNLNCSNNDLVTLNVSGLTNLQILNCSSNILKSIDVKSSIKLQNLNCRANPLSSLDLNGLSNLNNINLDFNNSLKSLYLKDIGFNSNDPTHLFNFDTQFALQYICANASLIPYLKQKTTQYGYNSTGYCLVIDSSCSSNPTSDAIVNIPDINFKNDLLYSDCFNNIAKDLTGKVFRIDKNADGQIQVNEASQVSYLYVSSSQPITSLIGIKNFTNLQSLYCRQLQLTSLDLSGLTYLQTVQCSNNALTSLNVTGLINLNNLYSDSNKLSQLNLIGLTNLKTLYCSYNQLPSLNLSGLSNLQNLECYSNLITSIDLSGLTNLLDFRCQSNKLTSLNLTSSTKIQYLYCGYNLLTNLDVSNLSSLSSLYCSNNLLNSLFLKNGNNEKNLEFGNNPSLTYICADDTQIANIQAQILTNKMSSCNVNSYCSFTPGGIFYTIKGNNKLDSNNNGCDFLDIAVPNLKLKLLNGLISGDLMSNTSGNYSIPVQAGTHTITPIFENPTYFNVSPTSVSVTFPTQVSPFTQDFCVTANGTHPDLEIAILPLQPARPGFDAKYKIIYKNKGNTTQSGSVNFTFNDGVLDFVIANPVTSTQTANNLSWNFTNLKPFETREIIFTLNVNSPTESPAVNSGFVLVYKATMTSSATDETQIDNTFDFNQTVVNSFDPNDKTCLEGTTISSSLIGQYVHYMIRFENKGTYQAKNIVVKDIIDISKFDISTLIPTSASHSYTTKISDTNKVEFIFENINLPFDDANNDGYIAFKIKTKPILVVNDTFINDASIFFDYNFPIVTNKATSTFKTLGTQDFKFLNYFTLYPNPVNEILNIVTTKEIEVKSIAVYDILGQLVIALPNVKSFSKIDVSNLKTGNYFIKINSDKGSSSMKFIKN